MPSRQVSSWNYLDDTLSNDFIFEDFKLSLWWGYSDKYCQFINIPICMALHVCETILHQMMSVHWTLRLLYHSNIPAVLNYFSIWRTFESKTSTITCKAHTKLELIIPYKRFDQTVFYKALEITNVIKLVKIIVLFQKQISFSFNLSL